MFSKSFYKREEDFILRPQSIINPILMAILIILLLVYYNHYTDELLESEIGRFEDRIKEKINNTFVDLEKLSIFAELNYSDEKLSRMVEPIVNQEEVLNISFVPKGIITKVFPVGIGENMMGLNLYDIYNRAPDIIEAQISRRPVVSKPDKLIYGEQGVIFRKAVFIKNEANLETLWGFVTIVYDNNKLLKSLDLSKFASKKLEYEFSSIDNNRKLTLISSSKNSFYLKNKSKVFKLPNGFWKIDIYKVLSFYDVTFLIIGLVFLILNFLRVLYFIKYSYSMQLLLYEESCVDPLTKAYNRRKLEKFDERSNLLYTVCYMDIDKFKLLNDTYGHDVGDQVLIEFTKRLKSIIRIDDLVIRLGGDEFLIILFEISDLDELNIFRSRLDEVLKPSYLIKGLVLEITSSMAFAISSLDGETLQEVMDYADKEMYKIKKQRK